MRDGKGQNNLYHIESALSKKRSPWLIRLRIAPTISATTKDRSGTPSETQHWQIVDRRDIRYRSLQELFLR